MHIRDVPTEVIAKITKLLIRAERNDGPEADTAAKIAAEIQNKWNIEVDLGMLGNPEDGDSVKEISFVVRLKCVEWRQALMAAMCELYGCTWRTTRDTQNEEVEEEDTRYFLWTKGKAPDLFDLRLHYRYLETEIERLVRWTHLPHVVALGAARFVWHLVRVHLGVEAPAEEASRDPLDIMEEDVERMEDAVDEGKAAVEAWKMKDDPDAPDAVPETALAVIPRRRVRATQPTSKSQPNAKVNLHMPQDRQEEGSRLVYKRRSIYRYAAVPPDALGLRVADLQIGGPSGVAALEELGAVYIGEVVAMRESQLEALPGITSSTINAIHNDLAREGLHFRPEDVFS